LTADKALAYYRFKQSRRKEVPMMQVAVNAISHAHHAARAGTSSRQIPA
jgi:hypothetical protein